ncbi:MAG TPA: threonine--tRNA ligase [Candidatus Dojkabacteria bacterium]|nr:threonine--tRNA ligase [Candidatus Dojkabacteria bacterium]
MSTGQKYHPTSTDIESMRHSFAHILAQAVLTLYPGTKMGIGPATEHGFYYDLEIPQKLSPENLPQIEAEMRRIINEELPFKQIIIPRDQAFDTLLQLGQIYKTELLQQVPDEQISFYKTGEDFIDLCRGPHVQHTGQLKAFKLTGISGVYWLGDSSRPQMQRIEGVAFATKDELLEYLAKQEELKLRDHIKMAKELNLFVFNEAAGSLLPFWLPHGYILKQELQQHLKSVLTKHDFQFVETPEISKVNFINFDKYRNYKARSYMTSFIIDEEEYILRADSSDQHFAVFLNNKRSYRDLPLKLAEFAVTFQQDTANLSGLLSAHRFTRISSHIFCKQADIEAQLTNLISIISGLYQTLGLDKYKIHFCLPNKQKSNLYIENQPKWKLAINKIEKTLAKTNLPVKVVEGRAEFYGPVLRFYIKDIFERDWELSSIKLDLIQSRTYGLRYINAEGKEKKPAIIHFDLIDSLERLIALIIENSGGDFPVWLAPVQVVIIPISEKYNEAATKVQNTLKESNIRSFLDNRDESMQAKIREAQLNRTPYMLIIGEKELRTNSVSVRPRTGQDLGLLRLEEFLTKITDEIAKKS